MSWSRVLRAPVIVLCAAFACVLVSPRPAEAGSVTFTDTQFVLGNYTIATSSNLAYNLVISQTLTGGNPGAALNISFSGTATLPGFLAATFLNTGFVYDPSTSGAIQTLDASLDRMSAVYGQFTVTTSTPRLLISQNGQLYAAAVQTLPFAEGQWQSFAGTLTSSDFALYDLINNTLDTSLQPDFSGAGSPITFGYLFRFNIGGSGPWTVTTPVEQRVDNYSVSVNAVPEPGTFGLLALGGAAVWCLRRRDGSRAPKARV